MASTERGVRVCFLQHRPPDEEFSGERPGLPGNRRVSPATGSLSKPRVLAHAAADLRAGANGSGIQLRASARGAGELLESGVGAAIETGIVVEGRDSVGWRVGALAAVQFPSRA